MNRVMLLSADTDKSLKYELSFHLRHFLKVLDQVYIKKNVLKIIDNYLCDEDQTLIFLTIESLITNFKNLTNDNVCCFYIEKIRVIFNREYSENFKDLLNIFKLIMKETFQRKEIGKYFLNLVKSFLQANVLNKLKLMSNNCYEFNLSENDFCLFIKDIHLIIEYLNCFNESALLEEVIKIVFHHYFNNDNIQFKMIHLSKENSSNMNLNITECSDSKDKMKLILNNFCNVNKF